MSPEDEYLGESFSRFCKQMDILIFFLHRKKKRKNITQIEAFSQSTLKDWISFEKSCFRCSQTKQSICKNKLGTLFTLPLIQLSGTFYLQFQVY